MIGNRIDGAKGAAAHMRTIRSPLATAVAVGLLMGMAAPTAQAVDSHWRGTVSTDWSDVANWDTAPVAGSHVFIDTTLPHGSVLAGSSVDIDQLTVGDQAAGNLVLSGGGVLAVHGNDMNGSGAIIGQAKGSVGGVTVTGAGSTLTVDQGVQIGSEGTGSLSVTAGGTANLALTGQYAEVLVGYGYYGQSPDAASGSGTVEVGGAGSTLNYAGGFNLLNGSLTVSDGGRLESHSRADGHWIDVLGLGQVATSPDSLIQEYALDGQGTATITGTGSSWQSVNSLDVGDGGTGRLSILDGATASFSGQVALGREIVTYDYTQDPVTGAGTNTSVGSMQGDGTVKVSGEGSALAVVAAAGSGNGDLIVGEGGDGTLSVDDKGRVDVAGVLTVGDPSKGVLTVTNGGTLAVHGDAANGMGAVFGNALGSEGDVTVGGAGSTFTIDAGLQVGNLGSGSLVVQQGGVANIGLSTAYSETVVGLGYYGSGGPDAAKGTGTITVDGAGSALNYAGGMNVLDGSLTVSNGGQLVSQVRSSDQGSAWLDTIGYGLPADDDIQFQQLNGTAIATIAGAGSTWNSVNALDVGVGGTGTLNVLGGGKASFTGWGYLGDAALLYASGSSTGLTQAGTGTVNVSGDGSSLTVAALPAGSSGANTGLFVGYKGEGTLSVADKGSVDVAGRLVVGGQAKGTLTIADGGVMAVHGSDTNGVGAVFGDVAGNEGDVTVSGAGSTLVVDAGAQIGNGGSGSLMVKQGGAVNLGLDTAHSETLVGFGYYGNGGKAVAKGVGTVTVDGAGSTLNYAGGFNLLNGSLAVTGGGHLTSHVRDGDQGTSWVDSVGYGLRSDGAFNFPELDGHGVVTVSGEGSSWDSVHGLDVGVGGAGTVSILDGGKASFLGTVYLGDSAELYDPAGKPTGYVRGGTGMIEVSGSGSALTVAADPGTGGAGDLVVGTGDEGVGTFNVDDKGSVDVAGLLRVGGQSVALSGTQNTLTVTGGGTVTVHGSNASGMGVIVGDLARNQNKVTVSGIGSVLTADGGLQVGNAGLGSLSVSDGGAVLVHGHDAAGIGLLTGSNGSSDITVSGSGSTLAVDGGARLGNMGYSTLSVVDGGSVSFHGLVSAGINDAAIPDNQAIESDVTVSGAGSSLLIAASSSGSGDGTLKLGTSSDNDFVRMAVRDGATVRVADGIDLGPRGTIVIGGANPDGGGTGLFAPGMIDTPSLKLDAPYLTFGMLTFDHSASTEENKYVFAANISGSGGITAMSGFTELTGDSSSYTGHVGVSGGTLSVNGSLGGDIDVLPGARLQGTGTVNDVVVGGTLAPGNSPGTLHVKGDLVMQAGSVYEAQIDPASGKSDSVEVAGNVTIQPGTTLEIQNLGDQPLTPGAQIDLIQSTGKGTVQGQFDNTEGDITDFMGYGVTYKDGKVVVGVTRSSTSFASVGDTPQARALGAALDGVSPDSALGMLLFGQLTSAGQAALAFKNMTGTIHADVRRVMLDDSRQSRDAVKQHLHQVGDTDGTTWWVHALGDWNHADGSNGLAGAKADSSGGMVGVDTDVGDGSRLGVAAGLGQTSYRMGDQGSAHLKDRHLALYGRSVAGHLDLGYGLAATWHDIGTNRAFAVGTVPQQLNSDSHARTDQLFVDAGYRFGYSARRYVEPYVALAHVRLHSNTVHEHGSATALDVASGSDHATFGTLGLRWSVGAGVAHWYGTLGWRHVFGFGRPSVQAQFAQGGTAFAVQGLPMARNAAQVELGASFPVGKRVHVSFGYDGLIAGSSRDNGAKAQLTMDL